MTKLNVTVDFLNEVIARSATALQCAQARVADQDRDTSLALCLMEAFDYQPGDLVTPDMIEGLMKSLAFARDCLANNWLDEFGEIVAPDAAIAAFEAAFSESQRHAFDYRKVGPEGDGLGIADPQEELDLRLLVAARDGDTPAVRSLLEDGASVDAMTDFGWTALHMAASFGHPEVARVLVKAGANVEARNRNRDTPLLVAVTDCVPEVVELLIGAKADVNAKAGGVTALQISLKKQNSNSAYGRIVSMLRAAGAR